MQFLFGIGPFGLRLGGVKLPLGKRSRGSKCLLWLACEVQVEPDQRMIGDVPELCKLRRELWRRRGAPEALAPEGVGAGQQGMFQRVDGSAKLPPQRGAPCRLHVVFSARDGYTRPQVSSCLSE